MTVVTHNLMTSCIIVWPRRRLYGVWLMLGASPRSHGDQEVQPSLGGSIQPLPRSLDPSDLLHYLNHHCNFP